MITALVIIIYVLGLAFVYALSKSAKEGDAQRAKMWAEYFKDKGDE